MPDDFPFDALFDAVQAVNTAASLDRILSAADIAELRAMAALAKHLPPSQARDLLRFMLEQACAADNEARLAWCMGLARKYAEEAGDAH